jgi:hypothetical protein
MRKIYLIVALSLFACGFALSQSKAGTSAAPELTIPVGAKYTAMAGASGILAEGVEAITWNPSGVDWLAGNGQAMFSYRKYIADIGINYLAVVGKFGFGSVGLSLRTFNIGDIPVTTEFQPDGTGEIISPNFFVVGLTYSKRLSDRVSVGANFNLVSESFGRVSALGVAFDAGVQYRNMLNIPGLSLGVVIKNIGPTMKYGGSGLWVQAEVPGSERGLTFYKVEAASFQMPTSFEIGLGYNLALGEANNLSFTGTYQANNFYALDAYKFGFEYAFKNVLFLRAGYNYNKTGDLTSIWHHYTLGVGLNTESLIGLKLSFDYAYVPVTYFSANHLFNLKVGF